MLIASIHNVSMLANPPPSLALLMHDISQRIRYAFDAKARDIGVTRQQWRTLFLLSRMDGPTQSEVADILEVERITLTRMIDRLADAGLVERRADPSDRRVWRVHLTEKASDIVDQLNEIGRSVEQTYMAAINPQEATLLFELLGRIRESMRAEEGSASTSQNKVLS